MITSKMFSNQYYSNWGNIFVPYKCKSLVISVRYIWGRKLFIYIKQTRSNWMVAAGCIWNMIRRESLYYREFQLIHSWTCQEHSKTGFFFLEKFLEKEFAVFSAQKFKCWAVWAHLSLPHLPMDGYKITLSFYQATFFCPWPSALRQEWRH